MTTDASHLTDDKAAEVGHTAAPELSGIILVLAVLTALVAIVLFAV